MKRQVIQFKMSRYLNSYFSKDVQKSSIHMKSYSTLVKVIKNQNQNNIPLHTQKNDYNETM